MSALQEALTGLRSAVENAASRLGDPSELERALVEERRLSAELAASEAAEDVQQNADLTAAQAEVDRLLSEQTAAAQEITTLSERLNTVGTAVEEAPAGTPVEEVDVPETPVTEPVPDGTDVPEGADGAPATPDEVPDAGVPADGGAPADETPAGDAGTTPAPTDDAPDTSDEATTPAPADAVPSDGGGPTDADGRPVAPPTI